MGFFVFFWFYSLFLNFLKCYYICFFIQQVPFFFQECDTNVMCFFFFNFIYLFVYFWLCWVFVSVRGLSLVAASGGHFSLWCAGLSLSWPLLVAEHRLQMRRPSNCGSRAQSLRCMWDLPRPGLEPVSPALVGRFSTTAPPGKPQQLLLDIYFIHITVYMSIPISQYIPPPPLPPPLSALGDHTVVLYVCVSISALQTCSPVPFFQVPHICIIYNICFSLSDLLHSV